MEVKPESRYRFLSIREYPKITEYITRFDTEATRVNSIAILIGLLTGLVIGVYDRTLQYSNTLFGMQQGFSLHEFPYYYVILMPALGGLLVGLISHYLIKTKYGVEGLIETVTLRGARIKLRDSFLEVFTSIITISSGGALGKEAPGVLAGAGTGALVGRIMKSPERQLQTLLGCGAAGGIAAAFSAPLAGVVFVVEVIYGELETRTFIPIVISSVFATLVSSTLFGIKPIQISPYQLVSPYKELGLYLILGLLAGLISTLLIRTLYYAKDLFSEIPLHPVFKPALGGLAVGAIGLFYPRVLGMGYDVIMDALNNQFTFKLLLILLFLKILAFSLTLASGGSGGTIVPSLFAGAMLGGAFGTAANILFPGTIAESGAYAMVGMGAVFAGTARAPLTAILILFEITRDYSLILPLMFACVLSNVMSNAMHPESIFTEGLRRRGFKIRKGREVDIMVSMLVKDAMVTHVQTVSEEKNVGTLIALMQASRHAGFPVLDSKGKLSGIVTLSDLRSKVKYGEVDKKIGDIATHDVEIAYPDETLEAVLKRLGSKQIGRLPVVDRRDKTKLLGLITRSDIVNSYNKKVVEKVRDTD
ncbi:Inosine-5'-monophosphate dehydrogenase [Methanosarcina horonobensis HB-1 = JCM 15518]|uniref:Inosine-5'-monophosphate dehydrogenase n=1 Tax=Methanosarcina horonobensis HB-1 = JCM 15518 TaxID=1434110 RepID=A0A0E3S7P5_9EURY|nr:chloride channel protein [Methanosarcina horonobensis]AKB77424.1 Inosine-5'-monophosphate dehydrogenase [Methanosarcina horonobensis HB-1 = JCM 15518]